MAHIVGFTNVEDKGQEGVELAREGVLAGRSGARQVHQGPARPGSGGRRHPQDPDATARTCSCPSAPRSSTWPTTKVKAVAERSKAKAASAVVLDAQAGEVLATIPLAFHLQPANDRTRLSGEQLRNRVQ